jgi:RNA polymerase sigma-70 factor (ECF subfamily)
MRWPASSKCDRLGRDAEAADAYRAALALTGNAAEQEFVAERVRTVAG